ncbi:ADP-ribosylglycohydrolase family protein [Desulfovibrio sp. OttesenSCG-928-G15]|nr:ADP-ribosylglycohydrolase family protein [Desulfovibrio sp. OttesenSCG-928-G15]
MTAEHNVLLLGLYNKYMEQIGVIMLGAIIGDIVGSPYEFTPNNIKTTEFPLFSKRSCFTDDTVMTVAVAVGIMRGYRDPKATKNHIIDALHDYGHAFPSAGYGQKFYFWMAQKKREPYNSYGNGSAMRVSPVAWAYDTLEEVESYAKISAEVSHSHPEGIKGACATAAAIFMGRTGATQQSIKEYISHRYGYDLTRTLEQIRPGYVHDESCQGSVPEAISAFLESTSFEDALRKAVSLGGDSDTVAAICGSIAEGYYGHLPQEIVDEALARLDESLITVLVEWRKWLREK